MLIFIQKVQKRGFQNSEPQKICPNPILVPTASKTVPFDSFWLPESDPRLRLAQKNLWEEVETTW